MLNKSAGSTVSTGSNNRVMCNAHGACKWGLIYVLKRTPS